MDKKEFFFKNSEFILNSIPPKKDGDLIIKNLSENNY